MTELDYPTSLPAILVGVDKLRTDLASELPWAHSVRHQHGGYACLQAEFYGALLPLEAVAACGPLMSAFDALASDSPKRGAFAGFDELESLHLTAGAPYHSGEIQVLQRFLARAGFEFPHVTRGTEALLEFAGAHPRSFFGWPVLTFEMPEACGLDDPDARHLAMGPLGTYPGKVLSQGAVDRLEALVGETLRLYLLWDNSD